MEKESTKAKLQTKSCIGCQIKFGEDPNNVLTQVSSKCGHLICKKCKSRAYHDKRNQFRVCEIFGCKNINGGVCEASLDIAPAHNVSGHPVFRDNEVRYDLEQRLMCREHPSQACTIMCLECNKPLCAKCMVPSQGRFGDCVADSHNLITFEDMANGMYKKI